MIFNQNKSVTLIELILALSLVGVIILGINSINIFSHYQVISSDRRAKLQNDISYCLDHITKHGVRAIGNEKVNAAVDSVVRVVNNVSVAFFIDANRNGRKDAINTSTGDYWIRYSLASNQLSYCSTCTSPTVCSGCSVLSNRITTFSPNKATNFLSAAAINVSITGRWAPGSVVSADNPEVTMSSTIQLPSVSTQ